MNDDSYQKVVRERLYDQVAAYIQDLVRTGKLRPGDRLPPERDLASRLGVARGVVREATRVLAERGLVSIEPGRGTFIRQANAERLRRHGFEWSEMMDQRFAGRTALITGAGGGIGTAIARRLASEGAQVALADLALAAVQHVAGEITAAGGRATAHQVDVTSSTEIARVLDDVERSLGMVTLAVTCAGIIYMNPFLDLPRDNWDRTLNVNLTGTFLVMQEVARRLVKSGTAGHLVAISSVAGRGGRADCADYAASKAGVISVVRSAALALAPHNITVNAVCPGVVDTEMTRTVHQGRSQITGLTVEESLSKMAARIPLGRVQTAADVADVVTFLLSEDARYVTGQSLNADGGLEMD